MLVLVTIVLFMFIIIVGVKAAESEKGSLLDDLKDAAKDRIGENDLAILSTAISNMHSKYKFSDDDIMKLGEETVNFVLAMTDFSEKLEKAKSLIPIPQKELKTFCDKLEMFLSKYKVTAEDTLNLGKAVTLIAMSVQKLDPKNQAVSKQPTKEDMEKVFARLIAFAKKYKILAADLVPLIYQLGDIGLTSMMNNTIQKNTGQTSSKLGISGEQIMGVINSLMVLSKKYGIDVGEILMLGNDISNILKK